jgi:hypothetical protein
MRNDLGVPAVTKRVNQTGGVLRRRVLVKGAADGEVKYPAAANAAGIDGVTIDDALNGDGVPLQQYGYAEIEAMGAIPIHSRVNIGDATGRIKALSEAASSEVNLVGIAEQAALAAGDIIMVDIRRLGELDTV